MDQVGNSNEDDLFKKIRSRVKVVEAGSMVMPSDDDPFFKKKLEEAYKTLEEAPLPEDLINRFKKSN